MIFLLLPISTGAQLSPVNFSVQTSATVQSSPAQIVLSWPADPNSAGYTVSRKLLQDSSWGPGIDLPADATSYTDTAVSVGAGYEYQVMRTISSGGAGYGYVYAGIALPLMEKRGKIILLVDDTAAPELAVELQRFQSDLVGDGWQVLRHDVSPSSSVGAVKSIVLADYAKDPLNVEALLLFGHIPVPYSGDIAPDLHSNHQGAWAADVFYGDMTGAWTDNSVFDKKAEREANWNIPGDGKFDQSEIPGAVRLQVGRVDFSNLTCYSNKTPPRSEIDLLRQYLKKNHDFRHRVFSLKRRGLICDNFGISDDYPYAFDGWMNFAPFFGANNVSAVGRNNYFPTMQSQDYLWTYACGGGGYESCDGVGTSDDFATRDVRAVFTIFFGSYFSDWDEESNFLRAALGSGSILAATCSGLPHSFYHHMAMGHTIGYSTRLSQNNNFGGLYSPQTVATHQVHLALMGDPTLRLHPVLPVSELSLPVLGGNVLLNWRASADTNIVGYHVYRSTTPEGPFVRISGSDPTTLTTFLDSPADGHYVYMVRAIKLEESASGSYYNPSQGIFASATVTGSSAGNESDSSARFVKVDPFTQGSWTGNYATSESGSGWLTPQAAKLPAFMDASVTDASQFIWSESTSDPRALQDPFNPSSHSASCWFSPSEFAVGLNFSDTNLHRVSFYFLDWDSTNRSELVTILDAATGSYLDSRIINDFSGGKYVVWDLRGSVLVQISALTGNNAVLSGIFVSDAIDKPLQLTAPQKFNDHFQIQLSGEVGMSFVIDRSLNLRDWYPQETNLFTSPIVQWTDPDPPSGSQAFYRLRPGPVP